MWALNRRAGSSTGADNISYVLLQRLPFSAKIALLELFNQVWVSGIFPAQWKIGTIVPIPKPDVDRSKPEGYRPITLLSCLGKLFERIVNRRLITELEATGKLDPRQHAFRAGKGVDSHLAKLESLITFEEDEHVEIISLDISKAYDTTYRPKILSTLTRWKFTGRMMNILSSFLTDRYFQVAANGSLSSMRKAENGVPQGSILSVTLFLVAMQPIFSVIPSGVQILLYADDVILVVKGKNHGSIRKLLRKAVAAAVGWATSVGFATAPTKSKLLHVCHLKHRKRGRAIKINNTPIPSARSMKILGVIFDSKLNFLKHLATTKQSCRRRINILRILGHRLKRSNRSTLLRVGSALITSKLFYGLGITSTNIEAMERILGPTYNDVVRQASGAFSTSPINSIMAEAGCLPFHLALIQRLCQLIVRLLEKTDEATNYPVTIRAKRLLLETSGWSLPSVCRTLRDSDREWFIQAPNIDNSLRNDITAGTNSKIVLPKFKEFISTRYPDHEQIYTDGSRENNLTGAGVATSYDSQSFGLPGICSVFSSEAYALKTAVLNIQGSQNTIILTDSASCLDALGGGQSRHPWIQSIEKSLEERNITFSWIPGHSGIVGNDKADELAKHGRNKPQPDFPIPAQDVVRAIKSQIWSVWELEWHQSQSLLRRIKPTPSRYYDRKCASEQRILTRIRIGHTRITHVHLIKNAPPPICRYCGVQTTVQHILEDCRGLEPIRKSSGIKGSLSEILANENEREKTLIKFLKDSNLFKEI